MYKLLLCLMILALPVLMAQEVTSGSLVMVRCDDGDGYDFLSSPSDIDLTPINQSFNANVDTIVLIHGFNVSYSSAKDSFGTSVGQLKSTLGDRNYVGFYWPSDTLPSFGKAVDNANQIGPYLIRVLVEISRKYGSSNRKVHLVSHSLGGRVVLNTLKENDVRYVKWGRCFQMASAVNNNVYFNTFSGTNQVPQYTHVFFSTNDGVLKYLYALYSWLFGRSNLEQFNGTPEKAAWDKLSFESKMEYLRRLDMASKGGRTPTGAFDSFLLAGVQRAEVEAMGLTGAQLGNPVSVTQVGNIDMSNVVDGHTYWGNGTVMNEIAKNIR